MKHIRFQHDGYSNEDRRSFTIPIYQNIFQNIKILIQAMKILKISFVDNHNIQYAQMLSGVQHGTVTSLEPQYVEAIKRIWADRGVQECYDRRREYQLSDSAKYYLSDLDRISADNYMPTLQDILRVRVPTTGIIEYSFDVQTIIFRMVDVGGQRLERRKWINCFDDVTSLIFIVALSDYDQDRMKESLALLKDIISSTWFRETPIIFIFNKIDLFEEKIFNTHLTDYFPDYTGPKHDARSAKDFIHRMFEQEASQQKYLYSLFTCAIDLTTNLWSCIFAHIKNLILQQNLDMFRLSRQGSVCESV